MNTFKRILFFLTGCIVMSCSISVIFVIHDKLIPEDPVPLWIYYSTFVSLGIMLGMIKDKMFPEED